MRARIRGHKYHAKPTTVDGIRFASQAEARRFAELKLLAKAGTIECLELQPKFPLYAVGCDDKAYLVGHYIADFRYYDTTTGALMIEDTKGFRTPLYRWKKKHAEAQWGITITEIGRATTATKAKRAASTRRSAAPKEQSAVLKG